MIPGASAARPGTGPGRAWGLGLSAAVVFLAVWLPFHPARPVQPTADVFTHLTVARHVVRGEGFQSDIAYPLSFAFDFARALPQPLVHRQPGFAVLLTLPVLATDADPEASLRGARLSQIALLGLLVLVGAAALVRRGWGPGVVPWLLFLGFNPLLGYAVDWVFVELPVGLLLLGLWLRSRSCGGPRPVDGILAGLLTLLRLDLFWMPIIWWAGTSRPPWSPGGRRRWGVALALGILVIAPWAIRTQVLAGQPFFSLQAYAEHLKDTRDWPLYSVYRQLEPQALPETLANEPGPVLRKAGRGLRFFARDLPRFAPLALLMMTGVALLAAVARSSGGRHSLDRAGPLGRAGLSLVLLVVQYSFFDHSLRHLLVLLPVLAWEGAALLAAALPGRRGAGAAFAAVLMIVISPCRLPGWEGAAREAVEAAARTAEQVKRFRALDEAVLFVPHGAIPWHLDRPAVWDPGDQGVRDEIRRLLSDPGDSP